MKVKALGWFFCSLGSLLWWFSAASPSVVQAQGFYAVTRVTPMAPARGVFFFSQGIGAQPRQTPTVSVYASPGPLVAKAKAPKEAEKRGRLDVKVLAAIQARAIRGNVEDQYRLGLVYARGLTGRPDLERARRWFAVAVHGGYRPAVAALRALDEQSVFGDSATAAR